MREIHNQSGDFKSAEFLPDGTHLLAVTSEVILVYNATTGEEVFKFDTHDEGVPMYCVAVSPDGRFCAGACGPDDDTMTDEEVAR